MFLNLLLVLLGILVFNAYLWYRRNFSYWLRFKNLPRARGSIFSGNVMDFLTLKTHFGFHMKTIYDDPKFRDEAAVGIYGLYKPTLLVRDPQLLKSIFIRDFNCFTNRFARPAVKSDPTSSNMLFFLRNSEWKDLRSRLTVFFSGAKLRQMLPLIRQVGENLDGHLKRKGQRFVGEIKDICLLYTIDISSTTIFGALSNSLANPKEGINIESRLLTEFNWSRALNLMCVFFLPHLCELLGARGIYKRTEDFVKSTIDQVIEHRERSGEKRNDLIDIFLQLRQEARTSGKDMKEFMEVLYAQAAIFLLGGFETSSSAMAHGLFELAKNPELQEKLRIEILETFAEGELSYESLANMEYLDMVVHEIMRLYPLLTYLERKYEKPFSRAEPYTLQPFYDVTLDEGIAIYISVYGLHYDEKYWPNPTQFDPERFSSTNRDCIDPMVYLPFGTGPRNCIGARLGMIQVKMGLIHFLKNHYVRICEKTELNPGFDPKAPIIQIKGGIYLEIMCDSMCDKIAREKM
ncbi:cytochrome P450 6g1-like [Haematobia irritans]|uniref:cytochrome P450 6g1-like n=1 Tax=Haematobia irritans TaxID=7368 RepID=UPI003F4F8D5B